jgi:glycyl-radical enzyme activating protein
VWEHGSAGPVFDIQRFCTHDGPGIRTTVFMKGCPLDCRWCHNPESKSRHRELFYTPHLCIGCGYCASVCPSGAHSISEEGHTFDRNKCRLCLQCAERCFAGSLEIAGREMTADQVLAEVEKDRVFYEESGGGMTLSGGEPTAQFEFTRAILEGARTSGIHTSVETCGFGASQRFADLVPLVDLFLWDIKDTDEVRHAENTGVPLAPILENLGLVDQAGGPTILRCLLIPGVNLADSHLDELARIYRSLSNCQGIELLAYHSLGNSKRGRLGLPPSAFPGTEPDEGRLSAARSYLLAGWGIHAL